MDPLDTKETVEKVMPSSSSFDPILTQKVAVFTSLFAMCGAFSGLMSSRCTTRAMISKNEATFVQAVITDEWDFFQSRNIRAEIAEVLGKLEHSKAEQLSIKNKINRLQKESDESYTKAKSHEKEREVWNQKCTTYLDLSKIFACALVLLQMSVVLVPLTLLVKKTLLYRIGISLGLVGVGYLALACFQYFKSI